MKRVYIEDHWNDTWKGCYPYDLLEIYGEIASNRGYAYAYENRRKHVLDLVKSVVDKGARILDVAAAQGNFTLALAEAGYEVTWNDIRSELAEYVEMKRDKGSITYKPGNAFEIDFTEPFDMVIALEVIEHVAHPDAFLENLSKLVKPGGYVLVSTPLGTYFKNKLPKFSEYANPADFESIQFGPNSNDHIFLLHPHEMEEMAAAAQLQVVSMVCYSNPLTHGHIKLNKLLKFIPKKFVFGLDSFTQKLPGFLRNKIHTNFSTLMQRKVDDNKM